MESHGSSAPGKSSPLIPQCPAGEESWMEPQPGSAASAIGVVDSAWFDASHLAMIRLA